MSAVFFTKEQSWGSTLGLVLTDLSALGLCHVGQASCGLRDACADANLWGQLYRKHWGSNKEIFTGMAATKSDFRQRFGAEYDSWDNAPYCILDLCHEEPSSYATRYFHLTQRGNEIQSAPNDAVGTFTLALTVKQRIGKPYRDSADGEASGPCRLIFQGSQTISLAAQGRAGDTHSISNDISPWSWVTDVGDLSDSEFQGICTGLEASLLIRRHSDGAVACIWSDIEVDNVCCDGISFGNINDEHHLPLQYIMAGTDTASQHTAVAWIDIEALDTEGRKYYDADGCCLTIECSLWTDDTYDHSTSTLGPAAPSSWPPKTVVIEATFWNKEPKSWNCGGICSDSDLLAALMYAPIEWQRT